MARCTDPELQALHDRLEQARAAETPDLVEIRACKQRIIEYLAQCVFEVIHRDQGDEAGQLRLRVISNGAPRRSAPRGICSPVKTKEIRRIEDLLKSAFGDVKSCSTAWPGQT